MPARPRRQPVEPPARPMIVAHRGASERVPEHTLEAYVAALEDGADGLECDVRLTRDGHLVCVHDRKVNRTSSGRGVVSEFALDELHELDFRSWHPNAADSAYLAGVEPDHVSRGGGLLTLETLLGLVKDAGRPVRLLIETKHPTRYGGLVEKTLVETLDRFGWAGRPGPPRNVREPADMDNPIVVMSFATTAIRRVKLLAPEIPTVLLMEFWLPPGRRDAILPAGVPVAGPGLHLLRKWPNFVQRAHARGHRVYVWTVDDLADVDYVAGLGVDTIITNRPAEVREHLAAAPGG